MASKQRLTGEIDKQGDFGYNACTMLARITVYTKPGCHLCEDALRVLTHLQSDAAFTLEEVNIQGDPALLAEYGEQIPVVLLNGEAVFQYTVDEDRLRKLLKDSENKL